MSTSLHERLNAIEEKIFKKYPFTQLTKAEEKTEKNGPSKVTETLVFRDSLQETSKESKKNP